MVNKIENNSQELFNKCAQCSVPFVYASSAASYEGDGYCDGVDEAYGFHLDCAEFNFDGGDCDLVDCRGTHFSEEYCISIFGYSCITGDSSWVGDGTCDEGENELGLNFNCPEKNYDGGDCEIPSRRLGK